MVIPPAGGVVNAGLFTEKGLDVGPMLMRLSREAAALQSRLVQLEIGNTILDC